MFLELSQNVLFTFLYVFNNSSWLEAFIKILLIPIQKKPQPLLRVMSPVRLSPTFIVILPIAGPQMTFSFCLLERVSFLEFLVPCRKMLMLGTVWVLIEEARIGEVIHVFLYVLHSCKSLKASLSTLFASFICPFLAACCSSKNMCVGVKWTGVCMSVLLFLSSAVS